MASDLSDLPLQEAKGIGPQRAGLFSRLGILTIKDALYCLPFRYEDRSSLKTISAIQSGGIETVRGTVISADVVRLRGRRLQVFNLVITDGTGLLTGRWFNQPYLKKNFTPGQKLIISGRVKANTRTVSGLIIDNPQYEIISEEDDPFVHTNRVVPVYRLTEGISQRQFRKIMHGIVCSYAKELRDTVPEEIMERYSLPPITESISQLHFPDNAEMLDTLNSAESLYHKRIAFDEFFPMQLGIAILKRNALSRKGNAFVSDGRLRGAFSEALPFALTDAQKRTISEVIDDMKRDVPMNRLIQGDVGCGKTVVALFAMLNAVECGYQAALMAPTETLAEQHYNSICGLVRNLPVKLMLLTGSAGTGRGLIADGSADIVIGTHALIQDRVTFKKLGLVVIDEQHKFGVMQRSLLAVKGCYPDVLVMTATPIPRSLALTLYGDLDCSVIDEHPPGRKPVITRIYSAGQKAEIYSILETELKKGKQAYVVYPAIDESEKINLKAAIQGKEAFQAKFPGFKIALLHGRMGADEREPIMASFKKKEIDILVSTTVIEVGLDVPNATVMIIVHAERFGLSQLHQLRGRVGRGGDAAYCIMVVYEPYSEEAGLRLDAMLATDDGFIIAEKDLLIRGPGELHGTKQAGMPEFRNADLAKHSEQLAAARKEAFLLIDRDPELKDFPSLKKSLEVFWKGKNELYKTG